MEQNEKKEKISLNQIIVCGVAMCSRFFPLSIPSLALLLFLTLHFNAFDEFNALQFYFYIICSVYERTMNILVPLRHLQETPFEFIINECICFGKQHFSCIIYAMLLLQNSFSLDEVVRMKK